MTDYVSHCEKNSIVPISKFGMGVSIRKNFPATETKQVRSKVHHKAVQTFTYMRKRFQELSTNLSGILDEGGWHVLSPLPNLHAQYATKTRGNGTLVNKELQVQEDGEYTVIIGGKPVPKKIMYNAILDLQDGAAVRAFVNIVRDVKICTGYMLPDVEGPVTWTDVDEPGTTYNTFVSLKCMGAVPPLFSSKQS